MEAICVPWASDPGSAGSGDGSESPCTRSTPPIIGFVGPMPPPSQGCAVSTPESMSAMCAGPAAAGMAAGVPCAPSPVGVTSAATAAAGARYCTGTTAETPGISPSPARCPSGTRTARPFTSVR